MSTIEKALAKQKEAKLKNKQQKETSIINANITSPTPEIKTTNSFNDFAPNTINLNAKNLMAKGFIYGESSSHHLQEEFRHIKRKLLNNAFGGISKTLKNNNLIMVTSSNSNEGKTFISINLALSLALEQDKTVLLIDADVLRPSIHNELEFENNVGLLEYLLSDISDLSEIMYSTNIANLKIIPAGKPHYLTNELLASERMKNLTHELAERYPDRIVIFDCPPILGVTETPVLSKFVGQAIIVVEESKTKLVDVDKACKQLNEEIAIGFVINKTIRSKKDVYGYYGYGKEN